MEKSSDLNPFALYFDKENTRELEKDFLYRQLIGFLQIKPLSDMMLRLTQSRPNEKDFEIRDFFFTRLLPEGFFICNKLYFNNRTFCPFISLLYTGACERNEKP